MDLELIRKWRQERGIVPTSIDKYYANGWDKAIKTIEDVETVLLFGREFEVRYKNYTALVTTDFGSGFSVYSTRKGDEDEYFEYDTDNLNDFREHASIGPYLLKDIVGKWIITWHA